MIQPVNNLVLVETLENHFFRVDSDLHTHESFQHKKEIYGCEKGSLSRGALDFIHESLFMFKAESAQDFLRLGLLYYDGKLIKRNYDLALSWFHRAERAGNVEAMVYIGVCRLRGQGVSTVSQFFNFRMNQLRLPLSNRPQRQKIPLGCCIYQDVMNTALALM
jgi:hypothetical protein